MLYEYIQPHKKHIFADVDGTLTESRSKISPHLKSLIEKLGVIAISGARREQMEWQVDGAQIELFAQSGNDTPYWKRLLTEDEEKKIIAHISLLKKYFNTEEKEGLIYIENRGSQITYSPIGMNNNLELKKKFDPDWSKRQSALRDIPFLEDGLEARAAGTTSIDYVRKGMHKGKNISDYIEYKKWNKDECVYLGDALVPGGNDETVIGVIDCIKVSGPEDTLRIIEEYISAKE